MEGENSDHRLIGMAFIVVGLYSAVKSLGLIQINISFRDWFALFLIVPSLAGIIQGSRKVKDIGLFLLGVLLLLWSRGVIRGNLLFTTLVSGTFIYLGTHMLDKSGNTLKNKINHTWDQNTQNQAMNDSKRQNWAGSVANQREQNWTGSVANQREQNWTESAENQERQNCSRGVNNTDSMKQRLDLNAIMTGKSYVSPKESFYGCEVRTILGNYQIDLRNAEITEDIIINVSLLLGGVDIYLPSNVSVINHTRGVLGDVRDHRRYSMKENEVLPIVYITGVCALGGLEIKE